MPSTDATRGTSWEQVGKQGARPVAASDRPLVSVIMRAKDNTGLAPGWSTGTLEHGEKMAGKYEKGHKYSAF